MRQKLKKLKAAIMFADLDQRYLAEKMGRCENYISERMTGQKPWDIWEIYQLCDLLKIPYGDIPEYFPKPQGQP